jgi:hypothetical protein
VHDGSWAAQRFSAAVQAVKLDGLAAAVRRPIADHILQNCTCTLVLPLLAPDSGGRTSETPYSSQSRIRVRTFTQSFWVAER